MQDLVPFTRKAKTAITADTHFVACPRCPQGRHVMRSVLARSFVWACLIALVVFASAAPAADLTPIGARKAGSADGRIPAWTGDSKPLPGWSPGKLRFEYWNHKDEKPLFVIDASNVDKYAANLSEGQIALLKTLKGYTMPVYPSHRECNYPDFYVENTRLNAAGRAKISADGWALDDALFPGMAFPNPKSGIEAIWDHLTRYNGAGTIWTAGNVYISAAPGTNGTIVNKFSQVIYGPAGGKGSHSIKDPEYGETSMVYYTFLSPAAIAGQAIVQRYYYGKDIETYYYFYGCRRVRRMPNYGYDSPLIGFENQVTADMPYCFRGNPDRFDWKIVGMKEIYVPYNNFREADFTIPPDKACLPAFVNPDIRRYELHRVFEVVATVKAGLRHTMPKRVFFLDEDTGAALVGDHYDAKGQIWKMTELTSFPTWELDGACTSVGAYNLYDLINGRYVADNNSFGTGADIKYYSDPSEDPMQLTPDFFSAETLRANSGR